jgi:DNA-directed RNA polymerase subunit RPC12/RpoP
VSGGQQLACLTCLKTFSNLQNLKRHLRLHLARDSHVAEIHSEGEDEGHKDSKMDCDFCPEKFTNKAAFSVHMLTHNTQELVCYVCKKSYSDRYSLRYHLRTHGIGRQIRCELCGKNFTKQSRLTAHMDSIHNNIRRFPCSQCDKSFKARLHLDNHFLQHSGERPFTCTTCGDTFRHKVSLVTHQRGHSDSRPYVCHDCGKAFRDNSTLRAHERVHSGARPYKCTQCDKTFTQRAGLNYHKHVHTGEKPHQCTFCPYRSAKKAALRCHMKAMHREVGEQEESPAPPSPPGQEGDCLVLSPPLSLPSSLPPSLPSFSLLKSYEEPGREGRERETPSPSLSPPLTPGADVEHYPFSYPYSSYPAPPNYPSPLHPYEDKKGGQYPQDDYYSDSQSYYPSQGEGEEGGSRARKGQYCPREALPNTHTFPQY